MRKSYQAAEVRNMFDDSDVDKRTYEEECLGEYLFAECKNQMQVVKWEIEKAFKAGFACALKKPKGEK